MVNSGEAVKKREYLGCARREDLAGKALRYVWDKMHELLIKTVKNGIEIKSQWNFYFTFKKKIVKYCGRKIY